MNKRARFGAGLAAVILGGVVALTAAVPAFAHDELVGSTPGAGDTVIDSPDALTLEFSAAVATTGIAAKVTDVEGKDWAKGSPTAEGVFVTVPLAPSLPVGTYTAEVRVVSSDTHPVTVSVPFAVASEEGGLVQRPTPVPQASTQTSPTQGAMPTLPATTSSSTTSPSDAPSSPAAAATPGQAPAAAEQSASAPVQSSQRGVRPSLPMTIGGVALGVLLLIFLVMYFRRPAQVRAAAPSAAEEVSPEHEHHDEDTRPRNELPVHTLPDVVTTAGASGPMWWEASDDDAEHYSVYRVGALEVRPPVVETAPRTTDAWWESYGSDGSDTWSPRWRAEQNRSGSIEYEYELYDDDDFGDTAPRAQA